MRKRKAPGIFCFFLALTLTACSSGSGAGSSATPNDGSTTQAPQSTADGATEEFNGYVGTGGGGSKQVYSARDAVVFRLNTDIMSLDPHRTSGTGNERIVQHQFYEGLFRLDRFDDETELNLGLAEGYRYLDAENTQLEIKIRQNVKFHNGDTLTADDVVYSLERAASTGFNNVATDFFDSVTKIDDYTVQLNLKFPYSSIDRVLAAPQCYIVSKSFTENISDDDFSRTACGTGPYVFENWVSGDKITFNAFADYWRGEAAIKKGTFTIMLDNSTAMIALENGEIDFTNEIGGTNLQQIRSDPKLGLSECSSGNGGRCVIFNSGKGVFSDVRLRQAVAMAIDRKAIWVAAYDSEGEIHELPMSRSLPEYPQDMGPLAKDIEKAKALVKEAGYENGLTVHIPTIESAIYTKPTVILQEQLAEIGIELVIEVMDRAAWNEKIITNTDFEITYWSIVPDFEEADAILYKFHSKNLNGQGNFFNYSNPTLDELLDAGRSTATGDERNEIYRKAIEILRDDAVIVSIHASYRQVPFRIELQGAKAVPEQKYYIYDWYWAA